MVWPCCPTVEAVSCAESIATRVVAVSSTHGNPVSCTPRRTVKRKIKPTQIGEWRILCPLSSAGSLPLCVGFSRYGIGSDMHRIRKELYLNTAFMLTGLGKVIGCLQPQPMVGV